MKVIKLSLEDLKSGNISKEAEEVLKSLNWSALNKKRKVQPKSDDKEKRDDKPKSES